MNYKRILQGILDIGEAMLKSGAENFRLEDSLYRMCKGYGFIHYDVFVIPSNIQITVETPDGDIITQIRHIEATDINFCLLYTSRNSISIGRIIGRIRHRSNCTELYCITDLIISHNTPATCFIMFNLFV